MGKYDAQFRTVIIMLFVGLLTALLGYVLRIYLARNYSITEYGMVYATLSFFSIIVFFMDLGVAQSLVRTVVRYRNKNDSNGMRIAFFSVFFYQSCAALLLSILFYFFSGMISSIFLHSSNVLFFKLMIVWFLTSPLYNVWVAYAFGYEKAQLWSYADLGKILFVLLMTLIIESFGLGILSVSIAYAAVHLFLFVMFYRKIGFIFRPPYKVRFKIFWDTLKYGLLISIGTVGWVIFWQTDTLVITFFKGLTSAGLYQVAVPIASLLSFFVNPINTVLYSSISNFWYKSKKKEIAELSTLIFRYIFVLIVPVVLTMSLFSETIIRLLFGDKYIDASMTLTILSVAFSFILLSTSLYSIFSAIGQAKKAAIIVLWMAILNLIGCVILVNIFGIEGVALSTLISGIVLFTLLLRAFKNFINIRMPFVDWLKIFFSGALFSITILLLKNALIHLLGLDYIVTAIISVSSASLVFMISLFLLRVLSFEQFKYFREILFSK
ncbi:MAG: flippase [Candidatus Woesearchaeota archaeon]